MTTWALDPERYSLELRRRVLTSSPRTGFVARRQANSAVSDFSEEPAQRVYTLAWEYASEADRATINGYLDSTYGGALPVSFTPPQGGAAVSCRIERFDASSVTPTGGVRMRVVLAEVL